MLWPASGVLAPGSQLFVQQNDGSLVPADYKEGTGTLYQGKQEGIRALLSQLSCITFFPMCIYSF